MTTNKWRFSVAPMMDWTRASRKAKRSQQLSKLLQAVSYQMSYSAQEIPLEAGCFRSNRLWNKLAVLDRVFDKLVVTGSPLPEIESRYEMMVARGVHDLAA
jgi:hypothetical protein